MKNGDAIKAEAIEILKRKIAETQPWAWTSRQWLSSALQEVEAILVDETEST